MEPSAAEIVREYIERVWNRNEPGALEALTAPGFEYQLGGQPPRDRQALGALVAMTHAAFPDWRVQVLQLVAEGEAVAVRWAGEVTHTGDFRGIAATGRRVRVSGINLYRVAGGRIEAEWEQMDSLGLLQQLGALPGA